MKVFSKYSIKSIKISQRSQTSSPPASSRRHGSRFSLVPSWGHELTSYLNLLISYFCDLFLISVTIKAPLICPTGDHSGFPFFLTLLREQLGKVIPFHSHWSPYRGSTTYIVEGPGEDAEKVTLSA